MSIKRQCKKNIWGENVIKLRSTVSFVRWSVAALVPGITESCGERVTSSKIWETFAEKVNEVQKWNLG